MEQQGYTIQHKDSEIHRLLSEFSNFIKLSDTLRRPLHSTRHSIITSPGPPAFCHPRRLTPVRYQMAKAEFEIVLQEDTARRSKSSWSSPLHLVQKKVGGWRPCDIYCALNARTIPGRSPVLHIYDFSTDVRYFRSYI